MPFTRGLLLVRLLPELLLCTVPLLPKEGLSSLPPASHGKLSSIDDGSPSGTSKDAHSSKRLATSFVGLEDEGELAKFRKGDRELRSLQRGGVEGCSYRDGWMPRMMAEILPSYEGRKNRSSNSLLFARSHAEIAFAYRTCLTRRASAAARRLGLP